MSWREVGQRVSNDPPVRGRAFVNGYLVLQAKPIDCRVGEGGSCAEVGRVIEEEAGKDSYGGR